jgi:hypothetical protein
MDLIGKGLKDGHRVKDEKIMCCYKLNYEKFNVDKLQNKESSLLILSSKDFQR